MAQLQGVITVKDTLGKAVKMLEDGRFGSFIAQLEETLKYAREMAVSKALDSKPRNSYMGLDGIRRVRWNLQGHYNRRTGKREFGKCR